MSSLTTDKGVLHYDVLGRGQPVIFLHGWLGSWGLWKDSMEVISQDYRTYALDFWGFGESGRKLDTFNIDDFVDLVNQFMNQMGIATAPLIGHSMGGTVSLLAGLRYPERISKIAIIAAPIQGSSLALPLKMAGQESVASFLFDHFQVFRYFMKVYSPFICRHPAFPAMIDQDIRNTSVDSFLKSIASLRHTDLTYSLKDLQMPVEGMYGNKDNIVAPGQWKVLKNSVVHAKIQLFDKARHFIMLDQPAEFTQSIQNFLRRE